MSGAGSSRESELCRQVDDQLRAQGIALESLIENLNEGVYSDGSMLCDDGALGKLEERVRRSALKLRALDSERDQIDLSNLSEFARQQAEFRQQRRALAKITETLTDQLDRDAQVLKAFRELVGRMGTGTQLTLTTLMHDALVAIEESDAQAARPRRAQEAPQAEPPVAATRSVLTEIKDPRRDPGRARSRRGRQRRQSGAGSSRGVGVWRGC